MKQEFRCDCPITTALDIVGDKWILVIIKQMLLEGKQTFKDFTESDESIATNILSAKLKCLERYGIVEKKSHSNNKKTKLYHLTETGLSLAPVVVELALWSDANLRGFNPVLRQSDTLDSMKADKQSFIQFIIQNYTKLSVAAMQV